MAMLPEHLLLGGIVLVIVMEVLGRGSRSALWVALGAVVASAAAAFWFGVWPTVEKPTSLRTSFR